MDEASMALQKSYEKVVSLSDDRSMFLCESSNYCMYIQKL